MSSANAGWLFYKKMYKHLYDSQETRPETLDENYIEQVNSEILKTKYEPTIYDQIKNHFSLTTIYPGLVIGTGYNHNAKDSAANFDFGFFFDHTSGMPIVPGSSVKGVIRSLFKKLEDPKQKESAISFFKLVFKENRISIFLGESSDEAVGILQKIEKHIFDGIDDDGNQIALYSRDMFMDAIVIQGDVDNELIFANDYITPHTENGLGEPTPNHMLKVRSGVTFEFNFELNDSIINDTIHLLAQQKLSLFQAILEFNGVGAKTNVGYGQFESTEIDNTTDTVENMQPAVQLDKTFVMIKAEVQDAKNGKSIKNKIKKESFDTEEKSQLLKIIIAKITAEKSLDENWFEGNIAEWMSNDTLSNAVRKKMLGNDYFDVLKQLLK